MSEDLNRIEADARKHRQVHDMLAKTGLYFGPSSVALEFDTFARAMNGDKSAWFGALKALVRRFGYEDARSLILYASPQSQTDWQIIIKQRSNANRPDGGKRKQAFDNRRLINEIGKIYYQYRMIGLSDEQSLKNAQVLLKLNLSLRTLRGKVQEFRKAAKIRGYVDTDASRNFGFFKKSPVMPPPILVADIVKKGRPRKTVQN